MLRSTVRIIITKRKTMSNIVDCLFSISSLILRILFPIIILGIEKPIEEGIEIKSTLYN